MIIGTGGSRIVRRKTLLEVSKSPTTTEEGLEGDVVRPSSAAKGRARSNSDCTAQIKPRSVKMKTFESTVGRGESSKIASNKGEHEKIRDVDSVKPDDSVKKIDGFTSAWTNIVNIEDVKTIARTQKQTLRKFEETNEMLHQFNNLSDLTFIELQSCYKTHIAVLSALKDDLDNIFHRVRSLKGRLKEQYPAAFTATSDAIETLKERQRMAMELDPNQDTNLYATAKLPDYSEVPSVPVPMDSESSAVPLLMASNRNAGERNTGTKQTDEKINDGDRETVKSKNYINPDSEQDMVVEMNALSLNSNEKDDVEWTQCDENKATVNAENTEHGQQGDLSENEDIKSVDLSKHDIAQDKANVFSEDDEEKNEDSVQNFSSKPRATKGTLFLSEDLANGDLNCLTNTEGNNYTVPTESENAACSEIVNRDIQILDTSDEDLKENANISNNILSENSIEKTTSDLEITNSNQGEDQSESNLTNVDSRTEGCS